MDSPLRFTCYFLVLFRLIESTGSDINADKSHPNEGDMMKNANINSLSDCIEKYVMNKEAPYEEWSNEEKLYFGVCYESNADTFLQKSINTTRQMSIGEDCNMTNPTWQTLRPGVSNTDYEDEFHIEIPIPPEKLLHTEKMFPRNARVLNKRGYDALKELLESNNPVCDTLTSKHMPIECRDGTCQCKLFKARFGNDYTVHFTEFRDRNKEPIQLEYDKKKKKCTFPKSTLCKVQPNEEHPNGYLIPCSKPSQKCLIYGNWFECNRKNVMKTLELYNIRSNNAKERYVPFRLTYPIPCRCSDKPEKMEGDEWPEGGYENKYILAQDYDDDDDVSNSGNAIAPNRCANYILPFINIFIAIFMTRLFSDFINASQY